MPNRQIRGLPLAAAIMLAATAAGMGEARAFLCYIPEKPESPVALRAQPRDSAPVVARLLPGGLVRSVASIRERNGWIYVQWMSDQATRKVTGKGWVKHDLIYGGECED